MTEDFIRNFFFERHIDPKNEWLRATIDFISRNNASRPVSSEQLAELLYEQWLYSDISTSSQPCLNIPPSAAKFVVSASMVVQIKSVLDVGTPLLVQFQKLTKSANENATVSGSDGGDGANTPAWEPKPRRMLWFEVTDGSRSLRAMEYRPITDMDTMTLPGAKLLLFGEIVCRNGVLLLSSENCQLLGGDVVTLAENNHPVKVMADKLKKDIPLAKNAPAGQALRPMQTNVPSSTQQFVENAQSVRSTLTTTQSNRPLPPAEKPIARPPPAQAPIDASRTTRPRVQQNVANVPAPLPPKPALMSDIPASRPIPPPPQQSVVRPPPPSQAMRTNQENWSNSSTASHIAPSSTSRSPAAGLLQPKRETDVKQTAPYWPNPSSSMANSGGAFRLITPLAQESHGFALNQASQAVPLTQGYQAPLPTQAAPLPHHARHIQTADRPKPMNPTPSPAQRNSAMAPIQPPHRTIQPKLSPFNDGAFSRVESSLQSQTSSPPYMQPSQQQPRMQNFAPVVPPPKLQKVEQHGPDLHELNLTFINDAVRATRYAIGTQLRTLKAVLITVLSPMRIEGSRWMLKIRISDGTANLDCSFDDALLSRLLCMTVTQAQELSHSNDQERKNEGNTRIKSLELSMRRMDLIFDVEFSAGNRTMPVIRNMVTLAEKFNCF